MSIKIACNESLKPLLEKALETYIPDYAWRFAGEKQDDADLWIGVSAPENAPAARHFAKPFRIGYVLDRVQQMSRSAQQGEDSMIALAGLVLNVDGFRLQTPGGEDIARLTEKEVALLKALADAPQGYLTRDALLEEIWGYRPDAGIETHTLETHIYRLRQKIEKDPANPKILLTDETGYRLG